MIAIPIPAGGLQVESDLQLDVDGVSARLVADGRQLTLSTRDAGHLAVRALDSLPVGVGSLRSSHLGSLRSALAELSATLDDLGLTAALVDDRGTVAEFGRGCHSSLARYLTGSDRARLGRTSVPVAATVARAELGRRRPAVGLTAVLLAGLVAVGLRRRSGSHRRSIGGVS